MTTSTSHDPRTYPIPAPMPAAEPDPRFSATLVNVVADVLEHHGYPPINDGPDLDALGAALQTFLYQPPPQPMLPGNYAI